MKNIYQVLKNLEVEYEKYDHPAVYTVEEAQKYDRNINAVHTKCLFLRNKKGTEHYLVVIEARKQVNLRALATSIGSDRLGFASAGRLEKYLALTAGAVSPFGLINDKDHEVQVVIDKELLKEERVGFHPNINTATLVITTGDFKKFLDWTGNKITYLVL